MSWFALRDTYALYRDWSYRQPPGDRCPKDGTALLPEPDGLLLHCPFDGWRGTAAQAEPTGATYPSTGRDIYTPTYTTSYGDH